MENEKMLTVIIPAYNEEKTIQEASSRISGILNQANITFELIFVDDGSKDETWTKITEEHKNSPDTVRGIRFSRNFGKEAAIYAGLAQTKGECACVIDCDLQHPPEKMVEMYRLWEQGYEIVEGVKEERGEESIIHSFAARQFYALLSCSGHFDMMRASDYKLLDRKVIMALINMKEQSAFFRALSSWVGFKTVKVPFCVQARTAGVSKWNNWSLIKYALKNITSFTSAPMHIVTWLGVIFLLISIVFGTVALVQKIQGVALDGFTTVILLLLIASSIIMISLGIIGYYIARIFDQVKDRPRYIISEKCEHTI